MVHPNYPTRALGREWRASYRRRARRLLVLALAGLVALVIVACLVVAIR